jgi:MFS family permease
MTAAKHRTTAPAFAALRHPGFRIHLGTNVLAMMADNIEHVISYWVMFQKFHSPALGGFAVIAHWLPFLLFSIPAGALADKFDPRRLIQIGMLLFIVASLGWGYFLITDTLEIWHCVVLLVIHGCSGVFWQTASQLLLHDMVPAEDLPSAVRLNSSGRYLGILVGPAIGGILMTTLGPSKGILFNTLFYMPLLVWLWKAPYGPKFRPKFALQQGVAVSKRAVKGFADIMQTMRDISGIPVIVAMTVLAGATSLLIGNSYHAQMPGFAHDLGHGDAGATYSMLLAADAAGAIFATIALELTGWLKPKPRSALILAVLWCVALACFAMSTNYPLALILLFTAGFFELAFASMAQTLVQLNAPAAIRGRVLGMFNMAALGLRAFSGVTVGLMGTVIGIHYSLAGSAIALFLVTTGLLLYQLRKDL